MDIARHIQHRGFRHWYERELLRGHANLLLLVLSAVGAVGAVEAAGGAHGADRLLLTGCAVTALGVGVHAMRRYLARIARAEHLAHQAVCPQCRSYARWRLEGEGGDADGAPLRAHCRDCGHRWRLQL